MLKIIEARAKALAEKAERLDDREIAHDMQDLHATIVSAMRLMERREQANDEQRAGSRRMAS